MKFTEIDTKDLTLGQLLQGFKKNLLWCINTYGELYEEVFNNDKKLLLPHENKHEPTIKIIHKHYGLSTIYLSGIFQHMGMNDDDIMIKIEQYGQSNNYPLQPEDSVFPLVEAYMNFMKVYKQETFTNMGYTINTKRFKPISITQERINFCKVKAIDSLISLEVFINDLEQKDKEGEVQYDYLVECLLLQVYLADIINIDKNKAIDYANDNNQLLLEF